MKKKLSIVLILLLMALPIAATAQQGFATVNKDNVNKLAESVEKYLNSEGYKYTRHEEEKYVYFSLGFELDGKYKDIDVEINAYEDAISFKAFGPEAIPEDKRDAAAAYMMRTNWIFFYAHFNLNMEDGTVLTYGVLPAIETTPDQKDIEAVFDEMLWNWEDFGGGLYEVVNEGVSPKDAYDKAKEAYDTMFDDDEAKPGE